MQSKDRWLLTELLGSLFRLVQRGLRNEVLKLVAHPITSPTNLLALLRRQWTLLTSSAQPQSMHLTLDRAPVVARQMMRRH